LVALKFVELEHLFGSYHALYWLWWLV